jgi:hypothetical protein
MAAISELPDDNCRPHPSGLITSWPFIDTDFCLMKLGNFSVPKVAQ